MAKDRNKDAAYAKVTVGYKGQLHLSSALVKIIKEYIDIDKYKFITLDANPLNIYQVFLRFHCKKSRLTYTLFSPHPWHNTSGRRARTSIFFTYGYNRFISRSIDVPASFVNTEEGYLLILDFSKITKTPISTTKKTNNRKL